MTGPVPIIRSTNEVQVHLWSESCELSAGHILFNYAALQIFVEGIPESATDEEVKAVAEEFGPVSVKNVFFTRVRCPSVRCRWSADDGSVVFAEGPHCHR